MIEKRKIYGKIRGRETKLEKKKRKQERDRSQ